MDLQQLRAEPAARTILEERAAALARTDAAGDAETGEDLLTFLLGGSSYSLPAASVREVQPLGGCTALPAVPPFVVGLVNVRGRLVAALDLRPLLEIAPTPLGPDALLLIVGPDDATVGLAADSVVAVRRASHSLAPAPSSAAGRGAAWVRGVDEELSLHLDPTALLADPRLIVNEEADAQ